MSLILLINFPYFRRVMKNDEEIVKLGEKAPDCPEASSNGESDKIDKLCLLKCFIGVLSCYIIYAICHESITRQVKIFTFYLTLI